MNEESILRNAKFIEYLFVGVWFFINIAVIFSLGIIIFKIIREDVKGAPFFQKSRRKSINPFDKDSKLKTEKFIQESIFAPYLSLIAIVPALGLSWVFFVYFATPTVEYIKNIGKYRNLTDVGILLVSFGAGIVYAKQIFHKKYEFNDEMTDFDYEQTIQRSKAVLVGYLAFVFFSLLFALAIQIEPGLNILRGVSILFISGIGYYIVFRAPSPNILGRPLKEYFRFGKSNQSDEHDQIHEKLSKLKRDKNE